MVQLVGRKVQKSTQAEQGLGNRLGKKDGREFGEVEGEVIWKIGRWMVDTRSTQHAVYPLREVNDREKDVGEEVDTCTQTLEAFGNGIDNEVAGVEFSYMQEGGHEVGNIHDDYDDVDDPHDDYDNLDEAHDNYDDLDYAHDGHAQLLVYTCFAGGISCSSVSLNLVGLSSSSTRGNELRDFPMCT